MLECDMTVVCGIDEAGRGPIIGPMVLCGVCVSAENHLKFKEMGARDSKELTPQQRNSLVKGIKDLATAYKLIIVEPAEIDKALRSKATNLNWLEADKQAEILNELKPDVAYIDCPSPNIKAFTSYIRERVKKKMEIICAHHADRDYPSVSAASILAKVERDRLIEELKKKININFGSGYLTDPTTQAFIQKHWKTHQQLFRHTWKPYQDKIAELTQGKLDEWK